MSDQPQSYASIYYMRRALSCRCLLKSVAVAGPRSVERRGSRERDVWPHLGRASHAMTSVGDKKQTHPFYGSLEWHAAAICFLSILATSIVIGICGKGQEKAFILISMALAHWHSGTLGSYHSLLTSHFHQVR